MIRDFLWLFSELLETIMMRDWLLLDKNIRVKVAQDWDFEGQVTC